MDDLKIMNVGGLDCYEKDGTAYLNLEAVARGLGFTETAHSGNVVVKWSRVRKYISEIGGIDTCVDGRTPEYIPENIFYRLAMKAKNEAAEKFQAKVADEIIPTIRKHGAYMTVDTLEKAMLNPDYLLSLATRLKEEHDKCVALEAHNSKLIVEAEISRPKVEYFNELVDRNTLTNLRDTAKELGIRQNVFINFCLEHKYLYRGKSGKLLPYTKYVEKGYFTLKEGYNEKTNWSGPQALVTPKGREYFLQLHIQ